MLNVRIGGVPEHFNLPWYLTLKNGEYKAENINLRWTDYYGGTGEMCKALRNNEIDLAVILTEGIVKDIIEGNPSKIVQTFVESPLNWGIHVSANSSFTTVKDLKGKKAAISRFGSGSHLMAFHNAKNEGWNLEKDLNFEIIKNLDGAVKALKNNSADYFMWEKYTTKPIVDEGIFKRIGNCPTPWPCFVIAATDHFIEKQKSELKKILKIINNTTSEFKTIPSIDRTIANRYKQNLDDVKEWLTQTYWSQKQIPIKTLDKVQDELFHLGILKEKTNSKTLINNI